MSYIAIERAKEVISQGDVLYGVSDMLPIAEYALWAQAELAALKLERDELRADKERLDWLESNEGEIRVEMIEDDPDDDDTDVHEGWAVDGVLPCAASPSLKVAVSATADTIRAAIDAARAAGQDSGTIADPSKHGNEKTTTLPAPCHIEP